MGSCVVSSFGLLWTKFTFAVWNLTEQSNAFLFSLKYVTYCSQEEGWNHARRNLKGIMIICVNQEVETRAFIVVSYERMAETGEAAMMSNLHLSILLDLWSPRWYASGHVKEKTHPEHGWGRPRCWNEGKGAENIFHLSLLLDFQCDMTWQSCSCA